MQFKTTVYRSAPQEIAHAAKIWKPVKRVWVAPDFFYGGWQHRVIVDLRAPIALCAACQPSLELDRAMDAMEARSTL